MKRKVAYHYRLMNDFLDYLPEEEDAGNVQEAPAIKDREEEPNHGGAQPEKVKTGSGGGPHLEVVAQPQAKMVNLVEQEVHREKDKGEPAITPVEPSPGVDDRMDVEEEDVHQGIPALSVEEFLHLADEEHFDIHDVVDVDKAVEELTRSHQGTSGYPGPSASIGPRVDEVPSLGAGEQEEEDYPEDFD